MQSFILAGGFATRLWPLTERRAKPLLPVAGIPLLSTLVGQIPGAVPVTVSTNAAFADDFKQWKKSVGKSDVRIIIEDAGHEDQKLGALGAVAQWITSENIDDDLLLLAGDNYVGCSMATFLAKFHGNPLIAGHDIADPEAAKAFGTIVLSSTLPSPGSPAGPGGGGGGGDTVTSFEEKPEHPKSTIVSTGWWVLPKSVLPILVDYSKAHPDNVGGIFEELLKRTIPVECFVFKELWKDIGSFESYMSLHCDVVNGAKIINPSATVSPDSELQESIDLGPKTRVNKSVLRNCIAFGKSTITDCVLDRCIIDEDCVLEGVDLTDKMLRRGTILRRR
ncbi:MAG: sugar phosphate nucleotidyltransferase [Candidatus Peribacteraceae bacterium]|nr:sugar phosphate nucleotidyltransferase [Candidatus Peribacteraceae bacterium]